jgi:low temperature requirement protein LtrA
LRSSEAPQQATFIELFFDLAFVVAQFQLSRGLLHNLTWSGLFEWLLMLLTVWLLWFGTTWITNRFDPHQLAIRIMILGTLVGSLVMAAALPTAFGTGGLLFAGAFAAILVGRSVIAIVIIPSGMRREAGRPLFWDGVLAVLWIGGALVSGAGRGTLWTVAVVAEFTVFAVGFPTPGIGRLPKSESPVLAEHMSERYRQFLIIALGESFLVIGLTLSASTATDRGAAFLVSIATTVLLWRIYIYRAGELLSQAMAAVANPGRLAVWASYAHLVMVAGSLVSSVGAELVLTHPLGHSHPAWVAVILGGPALFLAGRSIFEYTVFARVSPDRPIGFLVLVALIPATLHTPPLVSAAAGAVVLLGIAIVDKSRAIRSPAETPSPPES